VKLFIPGPVDVHPDVLQAMATPPISHRGEEIAGLHHAIVAKARRIMKTSGTVLLSTATATGLMEAAVRNGVERRLLACVCGAFSHRFHQVALASGIESDTLEVPWGRAIDPARVEDRLRTGRYDAISIPHSETSTGVANPIAAIGEVVRQFPGVAYIVDTVSSLGGMPLDVDAMGIDFCFASLQKALALPPGFALCAVSEGLLERSRRAKNKGWYFDLARLADSGAKGQAPTTPSTSHMFAMDLQFERILDEGLESRWERHRQMARTTRDWAKERFELFAAEADCADTLTNIRNSRGIDVASLVRETKRRGFLIGNGYGKLKGQAFRIAHMGERQPGEVEELLDVLDQVLAAP
jgi:aspartate aminotransferase-like enzyme